MTDNNRDNRRPGSVGLILGGIFAVAAAFFILTGGELGGEKKIKGDADLPPPRLRRADHVAQRRTIASHSASSAPVATGLPAVRYQ